MISYNNYDKLVSKKLIGILKILQELSCAENIAHDNVAGLNSSSAKKIRRIKYPLIVIKIG